MNTSVHPSAYIAPGARLGVGVEIGPFVVIEDEVEVGDRCQIGAHSVIKRYTLLGAENRIHEGVVLGGIPQDVKYHGAVSRLRIGDANIFRESVTIHRSASDGGETTIGNRSMIMANSHIGHDCRVGDSVILANNVMVAGHVRIESHAFFGGGSGIHQFANVGCHAMIGGNAKVERDVLPYCLVDGVPARLRGLNIVGLRRAGFSAGEMSKLKAAYRLLVSTSEKLEERLLALEKIDSPHVFHMLEFIRSSTRGFCRARGGGE